MPTLPPPLYTFGTADVPEVRVFELMTAWDHALENAFSLLSTPAKTYRFAVQTPESSQDLTFTDPDACLWLDGIHKVFPLDSITGAAVALRFLAIMMFLGRHEWAGHLLQADSIGMLSPHPGLIRCAANLPLMTGETFDEKTLRQRLTQDSNSSLTAAAGIHNYTG